MVRQNDEVPHGHLYSATRAWEYDSTGITTFRKVASVDASTRISLLECGVTVVTAGSTEVYFAASAAQVKSAQGLVVKGFYAANGGVQKAWPVELPRRGPKGHSLWVRAKGGVRVVAYGYLTKET